MTTTLRRRPARAHSASWPLMPTAADTSRARLAMLVASYKSGALTEPLMIDNDQTTVYHETGRPAPDDYQKVFDMDPHDLLEAALDLLGIPHEHV